MWELAEVPEASLVLISQDASNLSAGEMYTSTDLIVVSWQEGTE